MAAEQGQTIVRDQIQEQLAKLMASGLKPNLAKAFVGFWGDVTNVYKDANNPHHKNDYATLEAVLNKVKPIAKANGLAFPQMLGGCSADRQELITQVVHTSGEMWVFHSSFPLADAGIDRKTGKPRPVGPQQGASASSYLRRYTLMALAGISGTDDDDDGEAASSGGAADEEDDSDAPATVGNDVEVKDIREGLTNFKAKKKETIEETLARIKELYEERVKVAGSAELAQEYADKRKELRKAAKATKTEG